MVTGDASAKPAPNDMLRLRDDVRVERLGDEAAVLDARGDAVHRLTGPAVVAVDLLQEGVEPDEVPGSLTATIDELVAAGLVTNGRAWSRRRFMRMAAVGGAAWTAASVTSFALADPAAASTNCASGWSATGLPQMYTTAGAHSFNTGPAGIGTGAGAMYNLLIRAWGGGGGGGGGSTSSTGGGGGGGEYRGGTISVTECTMYTITVGAGGGGGGMPGGSGVASSFGSLLVANGGSGGTQTGSMSAGGAGGMGGTGGTGFNGGMGGAGGATTYAENGAGGGGGGAGGASSVGGDGGDGNDSNMGGAAGTGGGTAPNMGGNGGVGGNDSNPSGTTPGAPGGGGGGAEEALLGATGGMGAAGAVWVGV